MHNKQGITREINQNQSKKQLEHIQKQVTVLIKNVASLLNQYLICETNNNQRVSMVASRDKMSNITFSVLRNAFSRAVCSFISERNENKRQAPWDAHGRCVKLSQKVNEPRTCRATTDFAKTVKLEAGNFQVHPFALFWMKLHHFAQIATFNKIWHHRKPKIKKKNNAKTMSLYASSCKLM